MSGNPLSELPAVHEVLEALDLSAALPHDLLVTEIRAAIEVARGELLSGKPPDSISVEKLVRERLEQLLRPSLRRVINATGVVLHTNLGRAPLEPEPGFAGYWNLEYDLEKGSRGRRDVHAGALIERLLGKPGIVVNNNAAALYLVLRELAAGGEVIVSRGELIEIGEGFRIPDIMVTSGAVMREVGTTNKTHLQDYRRAINENTRLILSVHHSNFRITGFTSKPALGELSALGREHGIPVYEDLGSGCIPDLRAFGIREPLVADSLKAGVSVVSFSGDKLLGGPQAGIITGDAKLISRIRRNPMFRALRVDKMVCRVLEATLRNLLIARYDRIPALNMIMLPVETIHRRAETFAGRIQGLKSNVVEGRSVIGGGSTPEQWIPTWLVAIETPGPAKLERRLRLGDPPVIARIENDRLLLDLRTVYPEEEDELLAVLMKAAV